VIVRALGPVSAVGVGALAAAALLLFSNLDRALVLDVYLVYLGAVALQALARATRAATRRRGGSAFDEALRRSRRQEEPPERLIRLQGLVSLATATAGDFHHGLRPPLREAAAHALAIRFGVELDADERRAAELLGQEAWALLGTNAPRPANRFAAGPSLASLSRTVAAIERIAP
jgi:hypothetical protein